MSYFFIGAKLKVQKKALDFVFLFLKIHITNKRKDSSLKLLSKTVLNEAFSSERASIDHV